MLKKVIFKILKNPWTIYYISTRSADNVIRISSVYMKKSFLWTLKSSRWTFNYNIFFFSIDLNCNEFSRPLVTFGKPTGFVTYLYSREMFYYTMCFMLIRTLFTIVALYLSAEKYAGSRFIFHCLKWSIVRNQWAILQIVRSFIALITRHECSLYVSW